MTISKLSSGNLTNGSKYRNVIKRHSILINIGKRLWILFCAYGWKNSAARADALSTGDVFIWARSFLAVSFRNIQSKKMCRNFPWPTCNIAANWLDWLLWCLECLIGCFNFLQFLVQMNKRLITLGDCSGKTCREPGFTEKTHDTFFAKVLRWTAIVFNYVIGHDWLLP